MSIKIVRDGIQKKLDEMLTRTQSGKATARLYPLYQKLQTQRFMSENASEGEQWAALNSEYAKYKQKKYGSYPGSGTKMLIATSTLAGAVIGPGSPFEGVGNHTALFTPYSMQIRVNQSGKNAAGKPFTYPQYVAEKRPFMSFGQASMDLMKSTLQKFIISGD